MGQMTLHLHLRRLLVANRLRIDPLMSKSLRIDPLTPGLELTKEQ
jgi:hypothetical protein